MPFTHLDTGIDLDDTAAQPIRTAICATPSTRSPISTAPTTTPNAPGELPSRYGTAQQRQECLPRMTSGDTKVVFAMIDEDNLVYLDHEKCAPVREAVTELDVTIYIHPRASYRQPMYDGHVELEGATPVRLRRTCFARPSLNYLRRTTTVAAKTTAWPTQPSSGT
jgi:hypothetical protein